MSDSAQERAEVPVQSPQDAAAPDASFALILDELRRLRDEADRAGAARKDDLIGQEYHNGRMIAYAKCLRLLSGEDKVELPLVEPA